MRFVIAAVAMLALGGCQPPASNVAEPNESVVEAELGNEQAEVAAEITSEAANQSDDNGTIAYACDNGAIVTAAYAEDGNSARLTIGTKSLVLASVPAASGSKYHVDAGLSPTTSLTWWSRGEGAMLIEAPRGAAPDEGETTVDCLARE